MFRVRLIFVLILFAILLVVSCEYHAASNTESDKTGELYTKEFMQLGRDEQLKQCAQCHQQIFDNEQAGPHAAAYAKLTDHKDFVNTSQYRCDFYTKHVNEKYNSDCMRCHATANLFETLFKNHTQGDSLQAALLQFKYPPLSERKTTAQKQTGIDCLTCHFDGKGVISGNEKFKTPSTASCNPKYSSFFKNTNITCYPCHTDEYKSLAANFSQLNKAAPSCNSCHQETDAAGKGTHYHYWAMDKLGKGNRATQMLASDFSLLPSAPKGFYGVVWKNYSLPHLPGLCPEMIVDIEFLDKSNQAIAAYQMRINRKAEYDTSMYEYFGKKMLGGELGILPPPYGTADTFYTPAKGSKTPASVRVSVRKKQQYWLPDSLGLQVNYLGNNTL